MNSEKSQQHPQGFGYQACPQVVQQQDVSVPLSVSPGKGGPSAATWHQVGRGVKRRDKKRGRKKRHTAFPNSISLGSDSEKLVLILPTVTAFALYKTVNNFLLIYLYISTNITHSTLDHYL